MSFLSRMKNRFQFAWRPKHRLGWAKWAPLDPSGWGTAFEWSIRLWPLPLEIRKYRQGE